MLYCRRWVMPDGEQQLPGSIRGFMYAAQQA